MFGIVFTKQADRVLRRMPRDVAQLIREKIAGIAAKPYAEHNNATKLIGRPGYRLRVGDWRILYELQNDKLIVLVLTIGSRGQVYR